MEGIPWSCDENDLRDFFKGCGKIKDIRMARWQDSGMSKGYAHVSFAGAAGVRAAFGRDGKYLKGRYLTVQVMKTHNALGMCWGVKVGVRVEGVLMFFTPHAFCYRRAEMKPCSQAGEAPL